MGNQTVSIFAASYDGLYYGRWPLGNKPLPLTITTASPLPGGTQASLYSTTLSATGGSGAYTWSLISGSLPAGLTLAPSTGTISGTPSAPIVASFTAQVQDAIGDISSPVVFSLTIAAASTLAITTSSPLASAVIGIAYSQTMAATGGVAPYTWSITSASPDTGSWLSFTNPTAGILGGTPGTVETESVVIKVTDSQTPTPNTASGTFSLPVLAASFGYYDGTITVSGNKMLNGHGIPTQVRAANVSGMEFTYLQAQSMTDPMNGQTPNWSVMSGSNWKLNGCIIPLHEASILENQVNNGTHGILVYDSTGTMHIMDLSSNYLTWLDGMVANANAAGMYAVLSMHSTAPANMCLATTTSNNLQDMMTNVDNTLQAQWILANRYNGNPGVLYDLKCEPWLNYSIGQTLSGTSTQVMMTGGTSTKTQSDIPSLYRKYGMLAVNNISGVFRPGDTIAQGAVTATVGAFDGGGKILTLGTIIGGSGYTNGTYALTLTTIDTPGQTAHGNGSNSNNATGQITVAGGAVTNVKILVPGSCYQTTDSVTAAVPGGSGFSVPVASVSSALIYFTPDSAAFTTGTITKSAGRTQMTRLSTSCPCYVTSGTASDLQLTPSTNNSGWGSSGSDTQPTVTYDISSKVAAGVKILAIQILTGQYEYSPADTGGYSPWLPTPPVGALSYASALSLAGAGNGAVSANLAAPWPLLNGSYSTVFTNAGADVRTVTYTQGSTAITWATGLTGATTGAALTLSNSGNYFYDVPGSWVLEINSAAGGGAAPTTGWVGVQTTYQNKFNGVHLLLQVYAQYTTYNWFRVRFTGSCGSYQNNRVGGFVDFWDGTYGFRGAARIDGDSISANNMNPGTPNTQYYSAIQACTDTMDMCNIGGFITGGSVTNAGSGGTLNGVYYGVVLTGGTGQGAVGNITVAGGVVTSCLVTGAAGGSPGYGYVASDVLTTASGNIGGVSGFQYTVSSVQGAGYSAGAYPPILNGGQPYWTLQNWQNFSPQNPNFYGDFTLMPLGTNNLPGYPPNGGDQTPSFYAAGVAFINAEIARGRIPVIPTIPWTGDSQHNPGLVPYNAQIALLQALPGAVAGPDFYTALYNNRSWAFGFGSATQCTVSGTTLTIGGTIYGPGNATPFYTGMTCTFGAGIASSSPTIVSQLSGTTGGAGTYQLSAPFTISTPEQMTFSRLDQLHPAGPGAALMRTMWAQWYCSQTNSAAATVTNAAAGYQLAGFAQLHDVTQAAGGYAATAPILWSCLSYSDDNSTWQAGLPGGRTNIVHSMHLYPPEAYAQTVTLGSGGTGHAPGDVLTMPQPAGGTVYYPLKITVQTVGGSGNVLTFTVQNAGTYLSATSSGSALPTNPIPQASTTGSGTGFTCNVTAWGTISGSASIASRGYAVTIGATYPVFNSEIGEHFQPGLTTSPWQSDFFAQADTQGWSVGIWTYNPWAGNGPGDDVMIQNSAGVPTSGQGTVDQTWLVNHP